MSKTITTKKGKTITLLNPSEKGKNLQPSCVITLVIPTTESIKPTRTVE